MHPFSNGLLILLIGTPRTQEVIWTYIKRSEEDQDFRTSYVRSVYVLCWGGKYWTQNRFSNLTAASPISLVHTSFSQTSPIQTLFENYINHFVMIAYQIVNRSYFYN